MQVIGFTCSWALSGFGSGEAVIPIGGNAMGRLDLLKFYGWRLWAYYGGQPVWAGLPTGLADNGGQAVTVSLTELPGYLQVKQYVMAQTYSQIEQTTIAGDLAARLDNIGVPRIIVPGAGVKRDRTYVYLDGQSRGDLLTSLCQVTNGPEFRSEYTLDGSGNPLCSLRIAYPRAGSGASSLALVVPGGAASFTATWSSDTMRTRTFAVGDLPPGASSGATKPVTLVVIPQAGIPELDQVDDWPGVTNAGTLSDRANTNASIYATPALAVEAVLPANAPPLGSYAMGDDVAVALADPLVPSGYTTMGRLTAASADAAAGTVTWTVAITQPQPRRTASLAARLATLDRKVVGLFHQNLTPPPGGTNP